MTKGRLEAFSDGVIAIIITITILLIDLPEADDLTSLKALLPISISYLMSFIMVGTNWVNHHHLLQVAGKVDGKILWANLLYLFVLSFVPLATGWVGRSHFALLPTRVYVILSLAIALSYALLQHTIVRAADCKLLQNAVSESRKERQTVALEALALAATFIPRLHLLALPLLLAAMAPWIIPDLRLKEVFEKRQQDGGEKE
ncbi:MAG: DUF1211 domain-containing protein [Firmicutes bacterium]|nr:DUF1211 domain-containing protein [Bacillota bacterium]